MTSKRWLYPLLPLVLLAVVLLGTPSSCETRQCIDADAVSPIYTRDLHDDIEILTKGSTFFSIFRVALDKECPFWADNGRCAIRECSVCNCAPHEVPTAWRQAPPSEKGKGCTNRAPAPGNVDRSLPDFLQRQQARRWNGGDSARVWTVQDSDDEAQFVDLRKNPEAYTAYTGAHAKSIWSAVYNENCFEFASNCRSGVCTENACKEERVFYRLISGVHTSITAHLLKVYRFPNGRWGENKRAYRARIGAFPERIQNLNVALAIATRAAAKASKHIAPENYEYVTGDEQNDAFTRNALARVLKNPLLDPECRKPAFDESDMFVDSSRHRLSEFRAKFHNISKIMDCVGCEKCRLWGKLQFLGLGTALRILFEEKVPKLQRNEVIALVNLLHKLTSSVLWVNKMEAREKRRRRCMGVRVSIGVAAALSVCVLLSLWMSSMRRRKQAMKEKHVQNENENEREEKKSK